MRCEGECSRRTKRVGGREGTARSDFLVGDGRVQQGRVDRVVHLPCRILILGFPGARLILGGPIAPPSVYLR